MSFRQRIEDAPWKWLIISFATGFSIMYGVMRFVLEYNIYVLKSDCGKYVDCPKCPDAEGDTIMFVSPEYAAELQEEIVQMLNKSPQPDKKKLEELTGRDKQILIASELDAIYAQMDIIMKVINRRNFKPIIDSLRTRYKSKDKEFNKIK